jgi:hypothetical protein
LTVIDPFMTNRVAGTAVLGAGDIAGSASNTRSSSIPRKTSGSALPT